MVVCKWGYREQGNRSIDSMPEHTIVLSLIFAPPYLYGCGDNLNQLSQVLSEGTHLMMASMPSAKALAQEDGREGFSSTAAPALRNKL